MRRVRRCGPCLFAARAWACVLGVDQVRAPGAKPVEDPARTPRPRDDDRGGLEVGDALPALMGGARRAQLADDARLASDEERLGMLAAEQAPLAHVARDVRL